MKFVRQIVASALAAILMSGCMTISNGPTQTVTFISAPTGARVTIDRSGLTTTTPGQLELRRDQGHGVLVEKDGYQPTALALTRVVSTRMLMNFTCVPLFLICFVVDAISGDAMELTPDPVAVTLMPVTAPPVSAAPPALPPTATPQSGQEPRAAARQH